MARLNGFDPDAAENAELHCSDMIFYQLGIFAAFYISLIIIIIWMYCKHQNEKRALKNYDSELVTYSGIKRLMDKYEKKVPQRTIRASAGENSSRTTETKLDNFSSSRYSKSGIRDGSSQFLLNS